MWTAAIGFFALSGLTSVAVVLRTGGYDDDMDVCTARPDAAADLGSDPAQVAFPRPGALDVVPGAV